MERLVRPGYLLVNLLSPRFIGLQYNRQSEFKLEKMMMIDSWQLPEGGTLPLYREIILETVYAR